MKTRGSFSRILLMMALAITLIPIATIAQGAKIRMPDFSRLADKAKESVDISLDKDQLKSASAFFGGNRGTPDDAAFAELVNGLDGIYVKVFEFAERDQYSMRDIESVLRQVEREGWKKLLSVRDGEERVEMWLRDNHADGGMFFVASEPTELVMINIVGKVNLENLRSLQGRMGVPDLSGFMGGGAPPAPPAPARSGAGAPPPAPPAR